MRDNETDQCVRDVEMFMPSVLNYHKKAKVLAVEKAPLVIERTNTDLKYAAPATIVVIAKMEGADGGPIRLTNIPVKGFPAPAILDAEQYKSVRLNHKGEDKKFNYSDTNGFVGRIEANGTSDI